MKMNLKNRKLKKLKIPKIKLSNKNLFIFLVSLFILSMITGICFYFYMNNTDKNAIINSINEFFTLPEVINYSKELKTNIFDYTFDFLLIWVLGLSVIGIVLILFIFFTEGFSLGFSIMSILATYKLKGLVGLLSYLFPTKIVYVIGLFILTMASCKISYKIIKMLTSKQENNINKAMKIYLRILIISIILAILSALFKVFLEPFMIKFFTFFLK